MMQDRKPHLSTASYNRLCSDCGGTLQRCPNGIIRCTKCLKKIN